MYNQYSLCRLNFRIKNYSGCDLLALLPQNSKVIGVLRIASLHIIYKIEIYLGDLLLCGGR